MPLELERNTELGPFAIDDTVPALVLTVIELISPEIYTAGEIKIDGPGGGDVDLGTTAVVISDNDAGGTTLVATVIPDTTKVLTEEGVHFGKLTLLAGTIRKSVQPFAFLVYDQPD